MRAFSNVYAVHLPFTRALVINDPDMIREALVINGDYFRDRIKVHIGMTNKTNRMLFFKNGDHNWKRIRKIVSRAFTTAKLKGMVPCIIANSERFCSEIRKNTGECGFKLIQQNL